MNSRIYPPEKESGQQSLRFKFNKLAWMIGICLAVAAYGYYMNYIQFAWGVLAGLPLAGFNYWLLATALGSPHQDVKDAARSAVSIYGRSLIRLLLSLVALAGALLVSAEFALGVAVALMANMAIYVGELWQTIKFIIRTGQK